MADSQLYYGRNALIEALAAHTIITEVFYANDQSKKFAEEVLRGKIPLRANIPAELRSISHQGIAFRSSHDFYLPAWDPKTDKIAFVLLCNHIEDVQNLGSLARAAAAFGVGLIVHEERRSTRMNPVGVKVSAGQAFRMKFLEVSNLTPFCRKLRDSGYQVVGLDAAPDSFMLFDWHFEFPLALVVGSEGSGLSKPVLGQLDATIKIPMKAAVESLNANQAASIAMSWIYKMGSSNLS